MIYIYDTCIGYNTYLIYRYTKFENNKTRHVIYTIFFKEKHEKYITIFV